MFRVGQRVTYALNDTVHGTIVLDHGVQWVYRWDVLWDGHDVSDAIAHKTAALVPYRSNHWREPCR